MIDSSSPVCVVVGVGPGIGAAYARRFARDGQRVALLARTTEYASALARDLPGASAYVCDVGDGGSVHRVFEAIATDLGPVDTLLYNAGAGVFGTVEDIGLDDFEAAWRTSAWGALAVAKEVIFSMKSRGQGSIVFTGATASRRGVARTAAFAPAKAAQRSLAESLARHLWPAGIHVAILIVDGVVDLPRTRQRMPDKPDAFFVRPADVAETALFLTKQPRSAWTFEVEARPFGEAW
jgi:NAD(P)-dependent dehydrogenase (short-subunit alcohol dehydrogenase family)